MNIIWNKNPLDTIVELTDHEKEIFKLKIKIHELEEDLGTAAVYLNPQNATWVMSKCPSRPNGHTIESLIDEVLDRYLNMAYMYGEGEHKGKGLDKRVDDLFSYYMDDLAGTHAGDCTCVPCSCTKCAAESLLGIDTIKGLGKHSAYKINMAFGKNERTLDEALEYLKSFKVEPPTENLEGWAKVGGWEQHVPRWEAEAKAAYEWLLQYKQDHFSQGE
jgi:hypothetical protein